MAYQPIEDYGIIGDLHSVALVGKNGSIDFMCFPYFDSPTIFAALLDDKKGGRFALAPVEKDPNLKQIYLSDSNILLTRFLFKDAVAEISDFMPVGKGEHAHDLVRRVKSVRGRMLPAWGLQLPHLVFIFLTPQSAAATPILRSHTGNNSAIRSLSTSR